MKRSIPFETRSRRLVTTLVFAVPALAMACSVPVFRYGLEHWAPDAGRVRVFHREPLTGEAKAASDELQRLAQDEPERANIAIEVVNVTSGDASADAMEEYELAGAPNEPWMSVRMPLSKYETGVAWAGPLRLDNVGRLVDSPVRREILSRLSLGESAVWVLLESGRAEQDDAAATRLEERLNYLMEVMELPKLDDEDIRNGLVSVPEDGLRLAFSMLRLNRDDPDEAVLVRQLLATESDLPERREPMAFPVFGQGRVLYALIGNGIKSENIDRAASFLIGSCSCEVKEKNPGTDLIMLADWKGVVEAGGALPVDLPSAAEIMSSLPETVIIQPKPTAPDAAEMDSKVHLWGILAAIGAVVLGLLLAWGRPRGS